MHAEIFEGKPDKSSQKWRWHLKSNGRVVAQGEAHGSRAHAMRACKSVIRGVPRAFVAKSDWPRAVTFLQFVEADGVTRLDWS